jgi:hypothetical protein
VPAVHDLARRRDGAARACATGGLVGLALSAALVLACGGSGFTEREEVRPRATEAEIAEWAAEWDRRARPHASVPDPPGEGPIVSDRWWLSRASYGLEVRRRGARCVVAIHGVDEQIEGGGWTAFGEGSITGDPRSFRGAEARISWSCLGIRFRSASDGVALLTFSEDGESVVAVYSAYEAWRDAAPYAFSKAYGTRATGPRPPQGTLRGQIPYLPAMRRFADDRAVTVRGRVATPEGAAVAGAVVQLKGRDATRVVADDEGRFTLAFRGRDAPWAQPICAGATGHRNGETVLFTGDPTDGVVVEVVPLDLGDHRSYAWRHPAPDRDADDAMACGTCHLTHYTEWFESRHARSADHGHVTWERARMLSAKADAPDDCAACHQPAWAAATGRGTYEPRGVIAGNHCDLCHKVLRTDVGAAPGVFGSVVLARPDPASTARPGSIHHVFGPAPDVAYAYMGASFHPFASTSWLCAGCHQGGGVAGRPKVDTFAEWRAWAAARPDARFRECQDCHMPGGVTKTAEGERVSLFAWESLHRDPATVHSHAFPGPSKALAAEALALEVTKAWEPGKGRWRVDVAVTNRGAGHKVPTGTWTKHVAIGVWARQDDRWLAAADDVPRAALVRSGAPRGEALAAGDWRDPPGIVLGVRRRGDASGRPADFWAPPAAGDLVDERLAPEETRRFTVAFLPAGQGAGPAPTVEVRVVHRRGPIERGPQDVPWEMRPYDPSPEVEWTRVVR